MAALCDALPNGKPWLALEIRWNEKGEPWLAYSDTAAFSLVKKLSFPFQRVLW